MEAAEQLGRIVDEAPTYAAAHVLLASALDAAGRPADALEAWRRAAFLVPYSPLVHRERQRLIDAQRAAEETVVDEPVTEGRATEDRATEEAETAPTGDRDAVSEPEDRHPVAPPDVPPAPTRPDEPAGSSETTPAEPSTGSPTTTFDGDADEAEGEPAAARLPDPDGPEFDVPDPYEPEPTARTASPPVPGASDAVEAPLLPPLDDDPVAPPASDQVNLEDDGWTILEVDEAVSPVRPAAPAPPPVPTPSEAREAPPPDDADTHVADDLDDLISQLDAAPRITPDPSFEGPAVSFDDRGTEDVASETLAKIYAAQRQYAEAALVYERLAARTPDRADALLERAAALRQKAG